MQTTAENRGVFATNKNAEPNVMSETTVFCTARSRVRTQTILVRLNLTGFLYSKMSVLKAGHNFNQDFRHEYTSIAGQDLNAGLDSGGLAIGVFGLLAGIGALSVPGIGPMVAAGPIMTAPNGVNIREGTGGISGRLIWLGISEDDARIYENYLKAGYYLIAVQARNDEEVSRAKTIMESEGVINISMASQTDFSGY